MTAGAGRRFRPTLWPSLFSVIAVAILLGLGTWQLDRRAWKAELLALIAERLSAPAVPLPAEIEEPAAWDYRRVTLTGTFRHDREMPLSARTYQGRPGYHIVTPLLREEGPVVLVNRGWVPADRVDPATRAAGLPAGRVTVEGIARVPPGQAWLQPDNEPAANRWFWIDPAAMAARLGAPVAPVVVEAGAASDPDALPVGGQTRVSVPNNHLHYALTWYGLAAVLVIIYISYHWRRPPAPR